MTTPEEHALFGTAPNWKRHLVEVDARGVQTVLALEHHYRDTLGSIVNEVDTCFRLWPEAVCVVAYGGEWRYAYGRKPK